MDQFSPTPSFDESLSHDSAIGTPYKSGSSRVSSGNGPSASSPLAAPQTPVNTGQLQAQQTQPRPRSSPFDYAAAARQYAWSRRSRADSDTWPENQVPLTPSRPGSVLSDGSFTTAPESPASPSRERIEDRSVGGEVVERVLTLPRRRRTPSLRNAPEVQWNLSEQPPPRPSLDETESVVSEDDDPAGRMRRNQRARLSPVAEGPSPTRERPSPNQERPITPLLPATPTRRPAARDFARTPEVTPRHGHVNFSHPISIQYSDIPSPPRTRDAIAEYQPHRLSPLHESPHLYPQRYPGEHEGHPAYEPQPPYSPASSQVTYSAEEEDPSLSTARLLPVRRLTYEDVQRSEIAIASSQLEPYFRRTPPLETEEEEQMRFIRQLRARAARHQAWGQRHPIRRRMKKAWGKVKKFFDF